jgi:hypothetical protein
MFLFECAAMFGLSMGPGFDPGDTIAGTLVIGTDEGNLTFL